MDLLERLLELKENDMVIINGLRLRVTEIDPNASLVNGTYVINGNHIFLRGELHKYHILAKQKVELNLEQVEDSMTSPSGYRVVKSESIREVIVG